MSGRPTRRPATTAPSRRALAALVPVLALAALGLGACGRSSSSGDRATTSPAPMAHAGTTSAPADTVPAEPTAPRPAIKATVVQSLAGGRFDPAAIYAREAPGVVTIVNTGDGQPVSSSDPGSAGALGSGFVVSAAGEIATNAHVVTTGSGASLQRAKHLYVRFPDGNQVAASIVGVDPYVDVALLKVDPKGLTLRPLPLGHDRSVRVGVPVAAIGSPFGEEQSLSVGVVSARDRSIQSLTQFAISGAIQTDAAINHGNSGGPLLDGAGRVIGINSQIDSASGDGSGVGFAVPVDSVRRSLNMLRAHGKAAYAYLGAETVQVYPQLAQEFDLGTDHGAWIQSVSPGGPAARAGLRGGRGPRPTFQGVAVSTGGDVIVQVGDHAIREDADVAVSLQRYRPGDRVPVTIRRHGALQTVTVTVGSRPVGLDG